MAGGNGKNPHLFDGLIFSAIEVTSERIIGRWINYRYALMVYRRPHLAEELGINPVAVSGITLAEGYVLVAKRAAYVAQYAGHLEFVPSGGIDPKAVLGHSIDYREALLLELEEETGIDRQKVRSIEPTALIFDPLTGSWEVVLEMQLSLETDALMSSPEYSEFDG